MVPILLDAHICTCHTLSSSSVCRVLHDQDFLRPDNGAFFSSDFDIIRKASGFKNVLDFALLCIGENLD